MIRKSLFVLMMLYALPSYPATQVSGGGLHTCALLNDGTVSCWGDNRYGQLGNGSNSNSNTPVSVSNLNNVMGISAGLFHNCALLNDGTVSCWGRNYHGELGNGSNADSNIPVKVSNLNNVISISMGPDSQHTCALLNDGTVSCWGWNQQGQLGNGSNADSNIPVKVSNLNNVISISMGLGSQHTCALLNDSTVSCWGYNEYGQLGNGSTTTSNTPVRVSNLSNILSISGGNIHTCALLNDSTVSCWGWNHTGQLGNGSYTNSNIPVKVSNLNNVMSISAGGNNSCALLNDNTVSCWGYNEYGKLGNGSTTNSNIPVKVSNLNNVMGISTGHTHICALLSDGTVSCWGRNNEGQLGNGSNADSNIPVSVLLIEDSDQDGRADNEDNCPQNANPDQANFDGDAYGDACDTDIDGDGIDNTTDNCQFNPNPDQADLDRDGIGNVCDTDIDGDGIDNTTDNCPLNSHPDQADLDQDGIGDVCDVACEPAVYSNQTDQAYLPALEIPLATRINGKAINVIGLYSASLEIPFGFDDFKVKELTFIQTIADTDPCHATFMPDTGILTIPTLEVTAVISYLSPQLIEGPVLTCSATLQQSVLKPEVLSLIEYNCQLP